ncbi:MAG: HlyC/CorC family transporter [Clostridia bacterium]|nr:HlyC/CorC family transporter [Clostridia bacterium]MBO7250298.1 HlyC/CorC family transporter [Clostridia bacterium]
MKDLFYPILLQLILIILHAIFVCSETAIAEMSEARISQLSQKGEKKAKKLEKMLSNEDKYLSTTQSAITFASLFAGAFVAVRFSGALAYKLDALIRNAEWYVHVSTKAVEVVAIIIAVLILALITLLFGEFIPKKIATRKPEKVALSLIGTVRLTSAIFAPLAWILTKLTNGSLRLFGVNPHEEEEKVTEEEILLMVDAGSEEGSIEEDEKEIIQNVFEFNDITAGEIATHRTDIDMLCTEDSPEEWEETIHNTRHTFFPVYADSIDKIIGVLNAKDYFRLEDKSIDNIVNTILKAPYLVPETLAADVLLRNMRTRKEYFAVVMDEYGGTSGIVTLTDLLECIVGDIDYADDENAEDEIPEIEQIDEVTFAVSGIAPISEVEKAFERTLDEHDCDTIGGYIISILGSIPEDGASFSVENDVFSVEVTDVKDHRIEKAIITLKPVENDEENDEQ